MTTPNFLMVGKWCINPAHVVWAEWTDPKPGGEQFYDEDYREYRTTSPRPAKVELTLTSLEANDMSDDFASGYYPKAASQSETLVFHGEDAQNVWNFLTDHSEPAWASARVAA